MRSPRPPQQFLCLGLFHSHTCSHFLFIGLLRRYEKYKKANTVGEYLTLGGNRSDLRFDHSHGYLMLQNAEDKFSDRNQDQDQDQDRDGKDGTGAARAAPTGSIDSAGHRSDDDMEPDPSMPPLAAGKKKRKINALDVSEGQLAASDSHFIGREVGHHPSIMPSTSTHAHITIIIIIIITTTTSSLRLNAL